ncbi:hypothetical protein OH76DRAFT_1562293 [Lentinus brumalis]|uniref:Uncharacterized protein n=1 Tax=Lentinus brumalis TaxID=2498619 RepID=A0A371CHV7_9APHY|nr:hypothetical protein OH76DRAFT_1490845 [Polyporus brumalis]RDX39882.1 hypothetical protein OH76DRAFT_1562293 [Polyporus brumalis]
MPSAVAAQPIVLSLNTHLNLTSLPPPCLSYRTRPPSCPPGNPAIPLDVVRENGNCLLAPTSGLVMVRWRRRREQQLLMLAACRRNSEDPGDIVPPAHTLSPSAAPSAPTSRPTGPVLDGVCHERPPSLAQDRTLSRTLPGNFPRLQGTPTVATLGECANPGGTSYNPAEVMQEDDLGPSPNDDDDHSAVLGSPSAHVGSPGLGLLRYISGGCPSAAKTC